MRVEVAALVPGVTVAGENEHVVWAGRPLQAKEVGALKPLAGAMDTVVITVPPVPATVPEEGLRLRAYEGAAALVMVIVTDAEDDPVNDASPA